MEYRIRKNEINDNWELRIKINDSYTIKKQIFYFKSYQKLLSYLEKELDKNNF